KHYCRPADDRRDLFVITDIRALEIDRPSHLLQVVFIARQQIVDDYDLPRAIEQQAANDCGADKPGPSGNDVVAHDGSFEISDSRCRSDSPARRSAPGVKSKAS